MFTTPRNKKICTLLVLIASTLSIFDRGPDKADIGNISWLKVPAVYFVTPINQVYFEAFTIAFEFTIL